MKHIVVRSNHVPVATGEKRKGARERCYIILEADCVVKAIPQGLNRFPVEKKIKKEQENCATVICREDDKVEQFKKWIVEKHTLNDTSNIKYPKA